MKNPVDFPPLKPADLEILLALAVQDRHGYGLMKEVARQSEGRVNLELGSLYRLISRLERDGLIRSLESSPPELERRKYYALTELGRRALKAEALRLRHVLDLVQAQVLSDDAEGTV